jgi:membrane protein DedA with SNARE-associated domain
MFETIVNILQSLIYSLSYLGIFILMTIESSFIPFPSEVVMIPAGYLAAQGVMNIYLAIVVGVLGSIAGAVVNYVIGKYLGRNYLLKHDKFFFISRKHLEKSDLFFKKYGGITTFIGRLIPVVRQYISIPAGFADMNFFKFIFYTAIGAFAWVTFLALIGYYVGVGMSSAVVGLYNSYVLGIVVIIIIIAAVICVWKKARKRKYL